MKAITLKQPWSALALSALLMGTTRAADFPDMKDHWAKQAVSTLADAKVVNGRADGKFHPNDNVTGAEAATMVVRGLDLKAKQAGAAGAGETAKGGGDDELAVAQQRGILASDVKTNRPATRGQLAAMLANGLRAAGPTESTDNTATGSGTTSNASSTGTDAGSNAGNAATSAKTFKDVKRDAANGSDITFAVSHGLVNGYPDGTFKPDKPVTRAEAAQMVDRLRVKGGIVGTAGADAHGAGSAAGTGKTAGTIARNGVNGTTGAAGTQGNADTTGTAGTPSTVGTTPAPAATTASPTPAGPVEPLTTTTTDWSHWMPYILGGLVLLGLLLWLALRPKRHVIAERNSK